MSQQINLFNPIFLKQKKIFTSVPMAEALGVLLVGALAVAFYGQQNVAALVAESAITSKQLAQRQARLASVTAQFSPRQKNAELALNLATAEQELQSLHEVAGVLSRGEIGNTRGYSGYFRALARQSESGVWLTGVSIVGAGIEIGVRGRASQPALVPAYIGRLGRETVMRGKTFSSLQIEQAMLAPKEGAGAVLLPAPYVDFSLQSVVAVERP